MIGYDAVHPADFIYDMPPHHEHYLLILTHTRARFWQGEESQVVPANHAALFAPDSRIRYGACDGSYGNDWIIFDSDETYVTQFPLVGAPFPVMDPEYCHSLFKLLTWEHMQDSYETVEAQLMSVLMTKLRADIVRPDAEDYRGELLALRRRIVNQPARPWNVSAMAAQLHISAGYLQLLYKRQFGVSCMDDVIASRIRLAKDYLTHTRLRVQEIAAICGYNNAEHFSRQFRKLTGVTPGEFRKKGVPRTESGE